MAGLASLLPLARKITRERSRPGRSGAAVAVMGVVVTVRYLANAYLAVLMGRRLDAVAGSGYLAGSLWLLGFYAATAGAARACRTTSVLMDHPRLRAGVLPRSVVRGAAATCALLRPIVFHLVVLGALAAGVATSLWGAGAWGPTLAALAAAGAVAAVLSYTALRAGNLGTHTVEYLEILFLLLGAMANPSVELVGGALRLVVGGWALPRGPLLPALILAAAPAALGLVSLAALTGRRIRHSLLARMRDTPRRDPLVRLYLASLPVVLFALSYAVEIPLLVAGSLERGGSLRLSAGLLALRVGWYLLYLARVEGRLSARRPATVLNERSLVRRILASGPIHALLCLAPLALHLARPHL